MSKDRKYILVGEDHRATDDKTSTLSKSWIFEQMNRTWNACKEHVELNGNINYGIDPIDKEAWAKISEWIIAAEEEIAGLAKYKNATFMQRLKYLFTSSI